MWAGVWLKNKQKNKHIMYEIFTYHRNVSNKIICHNLYTCFLDPTTFKF